MRATERPTAVTAGRVRERRKSTMRCDSSAPLRHSSASAVQLRRARRVGVRWLRCAYVGGLRCHLVMLMVRRRSPTVVTSPPDVMWRFVHSRVVVIIDVVCILVGLSEYARRMNNERVKRLLVICCFVVMFLCACLVLYYLKLFHETHNMYTYACLVDMMHLIICSQSWNILDFKTHLFASVYSSKLAFSELAKTSDACMTPAGSACVTRIDVRLNWRQISCIFCKAEICNWSEWDFDVSLGSWFPCLKVSMA